MKNLFLFLLVTVSFNAFGQQVIREVNFSGSGYELGLQHGKLLKTEIGELVEKMKQNTSTNLNKDVNFSDSYFLTIFFSISIH